MKKTIFIKRIAVMLLATVLVLGSSLTAFAATVEQTNPKTTGVQLIGNTLLVNEDNHMMYVWGKSVMLQCPGVTDVLPNNNTKLVDVQFNGNLYKGIEEILIVKTQGKDDKIRLEEGSMIMTGVTTPEQVQKVKSALKAMPTNLAELKYDLIGVDVTLGATKNYIVEKDSVKNESGAKVDPKSIEGTVELINTQTVTQTPTESKPEEKKGEPGSSLSPPRHLCNHVFDFEGRPYIKCLSCGDPSPFSIGCTHVWNTEGKCTRCNRYCVHEFPEGEVGAPCKICGYQSTMPPCQHEFDVDENHYVVCTKCGAPNPTCGGCNHNWDSSTGICTECSGDCLHQFPQGTTGAACTVCGFNGSIPPTPCSHPNYNSINDAKHKCTVCNTEVDHDYDNDGYCSICQHNCQHTGQSAGDTCRYCGSLVPCPNAANHSSIHQDWSCPECLIAGTAPHVWVLENAEYHKCSCGAFEEHVWNDGHCNICDTDCPMCNGEGDSEDGCDNCGYFPDGPCPAPETHGSLHVGQLCNACTYIGTAPHSWAYAGPEHHRCSSCDGIYESHSWDNGDCTKCHYTCEHPGQQEDVCSYCGISLASPTPCLVEHSQYCTHWTCECGEKGTGSHDWQDSNGRCNYCNRLRCQTVDPMYHNWNDGVCTYCGNTCNVCGGAGAEGGCEKCGKVASTTPTHNCDTDGHDWDSSTGICNYCDASCPTCNGQGISDGCLTCGKSLVVCQVNHSQYCIYWTCECGEKGTGSHNWQDNGKCSYCNLPRCRIEDPSFHRWTDAVCNICGMTCNQCDGKGAEGGCEKCGKES